MEENPNSDEMPVFSFLKNITLQKRRDLKYFIQMPSNPCTKKEIKIAQYILDNSGKKKVCTNDEIFEKFFDPSDASLKVWQRTKYRIQKTFLRYYSMRRLEELPLKGMLVADLYEKYEQVNKKKIAVRRQKKKLEDKPEQDKAMYDYWLSTIETYNQGARRKSITTLDVTEQKLDELYLERKFLYLFEKVNVADIISDITSISHEEEHSLFLKWAAKKIERISSIKAIIYYKLFFLLQEEDGAKTASDIENLIEEHYENIDSPTLEEFSNCISNYYIKRMNEGKDGYAKHYLVFLSKMLNLSNGELDIIRFKNSIGIALIHNDTEYAWRLLKRHKNKPSYKKGEGKYVYNFIKSTVLLHEDKYTEASDTMKPYKLKDHLHDIDAQLLRLQLDYSLGLEEVLILRKIKMLKIRTQANDKISARKRTVYLVFLKTLKQLVEGQKLELSKIENLSTLKKRWLEKMIQRNLGREIENSPSQTRF